MVDGRQPACSDGIRNQGETGVDCGGPCPPCKSFNVTLDLRSRSSVEPGEFFTLAVTVAADARVRGLNVSIQAPEGFFIGPAQSAIVDLDDRAEKVVSWNVSVSDRLRGGSYDLSVTVSDSRGEFRYGVPSRLAVVEPIRIPLPLVKTVVELPSPRVVQDKTFSMVNSFFVVVYSEKTLVLAALVLLSGAAYLYYSARVRIVKKKRGLAYV